jgi:group I intron endonuclease
MGFIYKISNTKNNKLYIGITKEPNPKDRWMGHIYSIRGGTVCPLLMRAFRKYGEESFKFEVMIICFDEDLNIYEKDYIKKYNSLAPNGYNAHEGGEFGGNFLGKKHTEEAKRKMSIKSKEYNNRPDVKERHRQLAIELNRRIKAGEIVGSSKSEKWQEYIKNRTSLSIDTKNKIREGVKKYFENNKEKQSKIMTKAIGKKISQYTKENKQVASFDSIILASRHTNIGYASIQANAAGRSKSAGGFIWKYDNK